jgi:hypothetical protein
MYVNGVPIEFIQQLEERDLLDDLSYSEIIGMFVNGN